MRVSLVFGEHVAVGCDEFIDERPDLIEAEFGGGVRVEHGGMIDVLAFAGERGFDDQRLHVDVGLLHGGEMWRHFANVRGLQSAFINEHRDFDAAALWEVVDEIVVGDVAIHDAWRARFKRVDDERAIFLTAFV